MGNKTFFVYSFAQRDNYPHRKLCLSLFRVLFTFCSRVHYESYAAIQFRRPGITRTENPLKHENWQTGRRPDDQSINQRAENPCKTCTRQTLSQSLAVFPVWLFWHGHESDKEPWRDKGERFTTCCMHTEHPFAVRGAPQLSGSQMV